MDQNWASTRAEIFKKISQDDASVRARYLGHFHTQADEFSKHMAGALLETEGLEVWVGNSQRAAYLCGITSLAVTLHIQSMQLVLSGHLIAAGNTQRQVIESIALSVLASCQELPMLDRFVKGEYSSKNAVRDLVRHAKKLELNRDSLEALEQSQRFYSKYSHPTLLTMGAVISFSEPDLFIGAAFDESKLAQYVKEIDSRVNLAKIFGNVIKVVELNLSRWNWNLES